MTKLEKLGVLIFYAILIGIATGLCCYAFSESLIFVTILRRKWGVTPFILLPFIGVLMSYLYQKFGKEEERGNNLILDELHRPRKKIRARIVPLIYFSSLVSHLFGASVGREGVGVQMGAGIADQFPHRFLDRKKLLMIGMSAGFAAIFKTPYAGTIFGIEVLLIGDLFYSALIPCAVASFVGFYTVNIFSPKNGQLYELRNLNFDYKNLLLCVLLGILFGLMARFFSFSIHEAKKWFSRYIEKAEVRSFIGGALLCSLFFIAGSDRYHGMSEELIIDAFNNTSFYYDSLGKILTTAITVGAGYKGGEVMPLFIVGASFGQLISNYVPIMSTLAVALGFVSVFAGAANVPLTSIVLAVELFGPAILPYAIVSIFLSFLFSGHIGIYSSQRKRLKKYYFKFQWKKHLTKI